MPETEMITITKGLYDSLIDDSAKLAALENWGVDNWSGYDDAMDEYRNNKE